MLELNFSQYTIEQLQEIKILLNEAISEKFVFKNPTTHIIKLEVATDKVKTTSYYNNAFVTKARGLKGSWENGKWVFPISVLDHVKNAMLECYGVTGEQPYEVCTLSVSDFNESIYTDGLELFGRPLAKAYGRDSGAKVSDDIFLISGRFTSGGSVKNWRTCAIDASFEIHNFPIDALKRSDVIEAIEAGTCTIKKS